MCERGHQGAARPTAGLALAGSLQPESHSLDAGWAEFLSPEVSSVILPSLLSGHAWTQEGWGALGETSGQGCPAFCKFRCNRRTKRSLGLGQVDSQAPPPAHGWGQAEFLSRL